MNDLNSELFYDFLRKDSEIVYNKLNIGKLNLKNILENLQILKKGNLTLAGNLFFGKNVKKFSPSFYVDAVNFDGYEISTSNFISKAEFSGTLSQNFSDSMNFLKSNLKQIQTSPEFNSIPKLEIDEVILTELVVNAFIHRDYYIQSSIKIFIFYNRVEIISPGKLTNSLTIENIKSGISIHRNPILNSLGKRILPYSGYGSGIRRALSIDPTIEFVNDTNKEEFKCIINRL